MRDYLYYQLPAGTERIGLPRVQPAPVRRLAQARAFPRAIAYGLAGSRQAAARGLGQAIRLVPGPAR